MTKSVKLYALLAALSINYEMNMELCSGNNELFKSKHVTIVYTGKKT